MNIVENKEIIQEDLSLPWSMLYMNNITLLLHNIFNFFIDLMFVYKLLG